MKNKKEKYIKVKQKELKNRYIDLVNKYGLKAKYKTVLMGFIDIFITGILLWFALLPFKKFQFQYFMCYGTFAWLVKEYVLWLIQTIKGK